MTSLPVVEIYNGVSVADATFDEVAQHVSGLVSAESKRTTVVTALHVGGLNYFDETKFLSALDEADLVYADGVSVVTLARAAGASTIERAPTTDLGHSVIEQMIEHLGRRVRIGLVGGPPALAEKAGETLEQMHECEIVFRASGYQDAGDWQNILSALRDAEPDLVFVGMGSPKELHFCTQFRSDLPNCPVLTCGGWFGFLAGQEKRAPKFMQALGLEWVSRLAQSPKRLGVRYATGAKNTMRVLFHIRDKKKYKRGS